MLHDQVQHRFWVMDVQQQALSAYILDWCRQQLLALGAAKVN